MTLLSSLVCGLLVVGSYVAFCKFFEAEHARARARRRRQIDPWTLRKG
jgi:hypothetical protein